MKLTLGFSYEWVEGMFKAYGNLRCKHSAWAKYHTTGINYMMKFTWIVHEFNKSESNVLLGIHRTFKALSLLSQSIHDYFFGYILKLAFLALPEDFSRWGTGKAVAFPVSHLYFTRITKSVLRLYSVPSTLNSVFRISNPGYLKNSHFWHDMLKKLVLEPRHAFLTTGYIEHKSTSTKCITVCYN